MLHWRSGPCDVCGRAAEACVCPECPVCRVMGNPTCYADAGTSGSHGLRRSDAQLQALWIGEARAAEDERIFLKKDLSPQE
jgi:hypothetical protein